MKNTEREQIKTVYVTGSVQNAHTTGQAFIFYGMNFMNIVNLISKRVRNMTSMWRSCNESVIQVDVH